MIPTESQKTDTNISTDISLNSYASTDVAQKFSSGGSQKESSSCQHEKVHSYQKYDTCFNCGVFLSKSGVKNYKSKKLNYNCHFPPKTIYESMIKRTVKFQKNSNSEYIQLRPTYVDWIFELAKKLKITDTTSHLAVYLMDITMFKQSSLTSSLQLYAPVCLLLAAKTIELDERIPFIPKLKSYANSNHTIEDYSKAELAVLDQIDWNPQYSSVLELSEFLLSQGALFSSDEIASSTATNSPNPKALKENTQHANLSNTKEEKKNYGAISPASKENIQLENLDSSASKEKNSVERLAEVLNNLRNTQATSNTSEQFPKNKIQFVKQHSMPSHLPGDNEPVIQNYIPISETKIEEILKSFDSSYQKLANFVIRDNDFVEYEPKILAASCITFLRSLNKISPLWNNELETITQLSFEQISSCFNQMKKKYEYFFSTSREPISIYSAIGSTTPSLAKNYIQPDQKTSKSVASNKPSYDNNSVNKTNFAANYQRSISTILGESEKTTSSNVDKRLIFPSHVKPLISNSSINSTYNPNLKDENAQRGIFKHPLRDLLSNNNNSSTTSSSRSGGDALGIASIYNQGSYGTYANTKTYDPLANRNGSISVSSRIDASFENTYARSKLK